MKTSKRSIFIGLILMIVMLLGISMLTACNNGAITLDKLQSEYGVVIEGGGFEKGSTLISNEIAASTEEATEVLAAIADRNYNKDGSVYIFDIYVTKDGAKVQPSGKVKVSVPVPNVQVDNYLVFHVKDDNTVETLVPTVADGKISFETSSFSYFIIAEAAPAEHVHNYVWVEGTASTCTEEGIAPHYHCEGCGKNFNENYGEIDSVVLPVASHEYGAMYYAHTPNFWEDGNIAYYQCSVCEKHFDEEYNEVESVVIPKYSTNLSICVNGTPTALVIGEQSDGFIEWSYKGLSVAKGDVITLCQTDNAEIKHNYFARGNFGEDGKILTTVSKAGVKLEATPNGLMLFIDGSCVEGVCVYDEGVVTKEPTHLEEGIKTFKCIICGKTKEEPVAKTPEHSFGNWKSSEVDAEKHYRECACGEKETAECTFNETGICTVCGREKPKKSEILIVISGGKATFVGKETVTAIDNSYGKNAIVYVAQKNDVLNVTLNDQNGRVFKHWASATGTIIPDEDFSMLVIRSGYYYPVFEDADEFLNNKKIYEGNCEEGTLYMSTNSKGDIKYELEFANNGRHELTVCKSYNGEYHKQECVICGELVFEEHTKQNSEIEQQPTHTKEGVMRHECSCGYSWTESIPVTDEHSVDYDDWHIVEESKNGQYGKYRVCCKYCDYYEEYWYLGGLDFVSFIDGKMIHYQYTYGGKVCHDEYYYSYRNAEGKKVYVWAFQYAYEYSTSADNNDTYIFMYIDDEDPKTIEPIYLSKSRGDKKAEYLWAIYGYAHDVNDWVALLETPDLNVGCNSGMVLGNNMSARVSLLASRHDFWAEVYNGLRIPTSKTCNDFSGTNWEKYSEGKSSAGRDVISFVRDKGTAYQQYFHVDKATGITYGYENHGTSLITVYFMKTYKIVVSPKEFENLDENGKSVSYSYGDIEQDIKTLCAKRTAFNNFTLTVPQEPSAFRLIVSDPTNSVTLGGSYENILNNTAQVYERGKSITLSWQGAESLVFDRYEIWDFATQQWVVLSDSPNYTLNTAENPRKEAAYVRVISHEVNAPGESSETYTVTIENGYLEIDGEKYIGTVEVAANTSVFVYAKNVAGKSFDHWQDGNGEKFSGISDNSFVVTSDITLSPVYKDTKYMFLCGGIETGLYVSVDGGAEQEYYALESAIGNKYKLSTSADPESEYKVFIGWFFITLKNGAPVFELVSTSKTFTYELTGRKISEEASGVKTVVLYAIWTKGENPFAKKYVDIKVTNGFVSCTAGETPSGSLDNAYSAVSVSDSVLVTFFDDPTDGTAYTAWDVAYRYEIDGEVQHSIALSYEDEYDYYPAQYWVDDPQSSYPDGVIYVTGIKQSSGGSE